MSIKTHTQAHDVSLDDFFRVLTIVFSILRRKTVIATIRVRGQVNIDEE